MAGKKERQPPEQDIYDRFGKNLRDLYENLGMSQRGFADKIGFKSSTVGNWVNGEHLPLKQVQDLMKLATALRHAPFNIANPLDWLFSVSSTKQLSEIPINNPIVTIPRRAAYLTARTNFFNGVDESLWCSLRSGLTIGYNYKTEIKRIIAEKSVTQIRFLICPPEGEDDDASHPIHKVIRDQIRLRRHDTDEVKRDVTNAIKYTLGWIATYAEEAGIFSEDKLEVRSLTYLPATLCFLQNVKSEHASVLALESNFRQPFEESPLIIANKHDHEDIFNFYYQDFDNLWESELARPIDLKKYL